MRSLSGAPAAASPPRRRPRPDSCGFPEHAPGQGPGERSAGRSETRNAAPSSRRRRGRCRGICRRAGSPRPKLQRRPGLNPQQQQQRARRDVPSTRTEVLPPPRRRLPPHQEASPTDMGRAGEPGRGGGARLRSPPLTFISRARCLGMQPAPRSVETAGLGCAKGRQKSQGSSPRSPATTTPPTPCASPQADTPAL